MLYMLVLWGCCRCCAVMAGIAHTHQRGLGLPGASGDAPALDAELAARTYPPEEADELLSLQVRADASAGGMAATLPALRLES